MSKPIIWTIDDDPDVLRAVERDLRRQYGFHFAGSYYLNAAGLNEKWFLDRAGKWYVVLPDGGLIPWLAGQTLASTPRLTTLDAAVYTDPTLLFNAPLNLSSATLEDLTQYRAQYGFHAAS